MTSLLVVPAAPLLVPGVAQELPLDLEPVLTACDAVLGAAVPRDADVTVVAAADQLRDLDGDPVRRSDCVGHRVAAALLDRVGHTGVRVPVTASGAEPPDGGGIWVFVCDGSASVGPKPPRPGPIGAEVDELIAGSLRAGDLAALTALDDTLAAAAGCTTAAVWRLLARFGGARADSVVSHAPFGVRYFVAQLGT